MSHVHRETYPMHRRQFLATALTALPATVLAESSPEKRQEEDKKFPSPLFKISLAQWSNHKDLFAGRLTNLEWPEHTKKTHNILGLEYVNQFFKEKAQDAAYLTELNQRVGDLGMTNLLIMVDGEGHLGAETDAGRQKTVDQHKKWVDAARTLGCHSIRVNSFGEGSSDEEKAAHCVRGLTALSNYAQDQQINILVENHGGLSSNGTWMAKVLAEVGLENCGSLPDFGNFHGYDRYQGLRDLMPFAKGVSAKSRVFDERGEEVHTDFEKAMRIVLEHDYHGWVGIEFEGKDHSSDEGIQLTKALLEKVRRELS